jgi:hypothetical protein
MTAHAPIMVSRSKRRSTSFRPWTSPTLRNQLKSMKDALLAAARARMEGVGRKLAAVAGALRKTSGHPLAVRSANSQILGRCNKQCDQYVYSLCRPQLEAAGDSGGVRPSETTCLGCWRETLRVRIARV